MEHPEHVPDDQELREIVDGPSASAAGVAQKMFAEAVIPAARYIIGVVDGTEIEPNRLRFNAAQDIIARVLGKQAGQRDAWDDFNDRVTPKAARG